MPTYQIVLVDVELHNDSDARIAGLGAVSRIRACGGSLGGLVINGPNGRLFDTDLSNKASSKDLTKEAIKALFSEDDRREPLL